MGGIGSTRWNSTETRSQVECCFSILPPVPSDKRFGLYRWPSGFNVAVRLEDGGNTSHQRSITLEYIFRGHIVKQPITINATKPNYGGLRWWFDCPDCSRRVAHLHLPHKKRTARLLFLCRVCHDLSYESAQYHRSYAEGEIKRYAVESGSSHRAGRRHLRMVYGGFNHSPVRAVMVR